MQRYDIAYGNEYADKCDDGNYCLFTDHEADKAAAIAIKDAEIGRYRELVKSIVNDIENGDSDITRKLYLNAKALLKEGE